MAPRGEAPNREPITGVERRHAMRERTRDTRAEERTRWKIQIQTAFSKLLNLKAVERDPEAKELAEFLLGCLNGESKGVAEGEGNHAKSKVGMAPKCADRPRE